MIQVGLGGENMMIQYLYLITYVEEEKQRKEVGKYNKLTFRKEESEERLVDNVIMLM